MKLSTHLKPGTLLHGGSYRIEKFLGQGGFGITYLALQTGLNRKVAIKEFFMKEHCNRDASTSKVSVGSDGSRDLVERFRKKFIKEAQTIAEMDNIHIIRIHDVFEENGTAYYVMEYLRGGDLKSRIPSGGVGEADALGYIRQIADALDYIHKKKILHLDIKPANILFKESGTAVLIDFGISKHYDEASGGQISTTPVGISEGYAPMEQYEREGISSFSASTDIYSLGATLYCLLQGERPPKASIVLNEGLPELPSRVSQSTSRAIEKAMSPRRKDRPQSVEEFIAMLDSCSSAEEPVVAELVEDGRDVTVHRVKEPDLNKEKESTDDGDRSAVVEHIEVESNKRAVPLKKIIGVLVAVAVFLGLIFIAGGKINEKIITEELQTSIGGEENGHEWVDLGLSVKWATCNVASYIVGASTPSDYGDYYAWGETTTKSEYTGENSKTYDMDEISGDSSYDKDTDDISGNPSYDAARANWGGKWRLPTKSELEELVYRCRWEWTTHGGHNGYRVIGPNGNSIFLPAAGAREGASLYLAGKSGYYWSSSPEEGSVRFAYGFYFDSSYRDVDWYIRYSGHCVRPVFSETEFVNEKAVAQQENQATLESERKAEKDRLAKERSTKEEREGEVAETKNKVKEESARKAEETRNGGQERLRQRATTSKGAHQGHEWVDLGLSVKWAICNVGASIPSDYGNYYAWGETTTKSEYTANNSTTYDRDMGDISGNPSYDAARANWGGKWRLPTESESKELERRCQWQWTTENGHNGYRVTGPNGNSIFLPAAGLRNGSSLVGVGKYGACWNSNPYGETGSNAGDLYFNSSHISGTGSIRYIGKSIRPVLE